MVDGIHVISIFMDMIIKLLLILLVITVINYMRK